MIDPKLIQKLSRLNNVLLPNRRKEIDSIYEAVRQLDIHCHGHSNASKAEKTKFAKEGAFKDVTLYPVLSSEQQKKVFASFDIANRRILTKLRRILEPYATQLKKQRQTMNQFFGSINKRLRHIGARYRRRK